MEGVKLEFTKFTERNYPAWKIKMKMYLMQNSCWGAITGDDQSREANDKALVSIGFEIHDDQVIYVQDAETAEEAWDNLAAVYDNPGTATKMYLQEQLMTAKLGHGNPVKAHIEHLRGVVSQLTDIGYKVSDDECKLALLRSLPSSFESIVVTLENLIDSLKIEDIHARLLREEARQKLQNGADKRSEGSLFKAGNGKKDIVCYGGGKKGHIKGNCRDQRIIPR